jgi:hypothetical protein
VNTAVAAPWYRYRAVWLLIAGPAIVVVAGFVTLFIAVRTDDGLVAKDYYKRGLAINRTLAREARAESMHLSAQLEFVDGDVRVNLAGTPDATAITLRFIHPGRADRDRVVQLVPLAEGAYHATLGTLGAGHWNVVLESDAWRIEGDFDAPAKHLTLLPRGPAPDA